MSKHGQVVVLFLWQSSDWRGVKNDSSFFEAVSGILVVNQEVRTVELGTRLRQIRRDNLLTQQDIADECHVSRQTVSAWETGRSYPDITSLITLAEAYHLSLDTLVREDTAVTASLVREDAMRKEARLVYYSVVAVDIAITGLVYLSLFKVPGFALPVLVRLALTLIMLASLLAVGPSQRRYQRLRGRPVLRTLTLGNVCLSGLVVGLMIGLMYAIIGPGAAFWGGVTGGVVTLIGMIIVHRVKYGPMRLTWRLR